VQVTRQKALTFILLIAISATIAYGRDYAVRRKIDGYTVDIAINQNPPIVGKNVLRVVIKDPLGQYIANAPVTVNYYMAPMPGMASMNYTVKALPRDDGYNATMDLIMTGPWNITIRTSVAEKTLRVTVPIDVR
jgi:hypothetical protein